MPSLPGGGNFHPLPSSFGTGVGDGASSIPRPGSTPSRPSVSDRGAAARASRASRREAATAEPLSKGDERRMKLARFRNPSASVAKSAAHNGVVERPMERQVSHSLDIRRSEAKTRGSSVGRLKKTWQEEDEERERLRQEEEARVAEEARKEAEGTTTSAARMGNPMINDLKLSRMPYEVLHPKPRPNQDSTPDMEI